MWKKIWDDNREDVNLPLGHTVQTELPVEVAYQPGAQTVGATDAGYGQYDPAGQGSQDVLPRVE